MSLSLTMPRYTICSKLSLSDRVIESRPINLEAAAAADVGCLGEGLREMTLHCPLARCSAREIDLIRGREAGGRVGQLLNVFMTFV